MSVGYSCWPTGLIGEYFHIVEVGMAKKFLLKKDKLLKDKKLLKDEALESIQGGRGVDTTITKDRTTTK